ncbi:MAG: LacI family DNA-binding transcriptional regulator [Bifidobacterium aquikefiri]|uniref:PurR family transcriptional regulator n=1 Tax=Bifidobacterium aquikefiri TaxID=1653207 RepID=A0A261GAR1_9BIFI|nr:LacI family DNA-binding transcriptional regulator [Bifidobacterium aquikefiri]OZG68521.1 PurR family transcriptional regulator [Bifidobacterium aquikefiri]
MGIHQTTIQDLAKICHVSTATVSRALNHKAGVSSSLRKEIIATAKEYSYLPDSNARAMRMGSSSTNVCLVVRTGQDVAHLLTMQDFEMFQQTLGMRLSTLYVPYDADVIDAMVAEENRNTVSLFIIIGWTLISDSRRFSQVKQPILFVSSDDAPDNYAAVVSDERFGSQQAANALLDAGHRRMLILTEENSGGMPYFKDRISGVKDAFAHHHLPFGSATVFSIPIDYRRYKTSAESFVARTIIPYLRQSGNGSPTAVAVMSDFLAAALIHVLYENDFQVPEQLSIASFGGWDITNYFPQPITSWVQPIPDLLRTTLNAIPLLLEHKDFSGTIALGSMHPNGERGRAEAISSRRFVVSGFLRQGRTIRVLP